jgi:hypothetical protein
MSTSLDRLTDARAHPSIVLKGWQVLADGKSLSLLTSTPTIEDENDEEMAEGEELTEPGTGKKRKADRQVRPTMRWAGYSQRVACRLSHCINSTR